MNDETMANAAAQTGQDSGPEQPGIDDLKTQAMSFLERAQEMIEDAVDTAVGAAKENPLAAAAIAASVVAAAAGTAYGISTMRSDGKQPDAELS